MAIAFVQQVNNQSNTAVTSLQVTVPGVTAGNMLVVVVGWGSATGTVSSVSDGVNTYSVAAALKQGNGNSQVIYYAPNVASGSTTITVNFGQSTNFIDIRVAEYSGVDTADVSSSNTGASGTNTTAGNLTTTKANELIVAAGITGSSYSSAGTGFTKRVITANGSILEDEIVSSTGTYNPAATLSGSNSWVFQAATFYSSASDVSATDTESFSDTATCSTSGISFVQKNTAQGDPSASSVQVTLNGTAAGNLLVVAIGFSDTVSNIVSVSDGVNTYSVAAALTRGTNISQAIYYAPNIAGGNVTLTVTFNQAASYVDVRLLEYSGVNTLDVTSSGFGSSNGGDSGSATTTHATELIFGAGVTTWGYTTVGSGFTQRDISPNDSIEEDKIVSAIGTYNATATQSATGHWVFQMATFYSSGGTQAVSVTAEDTLTLSEISRITSSAPAFIQQVENKGSASSLALSLNGVADGSLLAVWISFDDSVTNILSVSDGVNTYLIAAALTRSAAGGLSQAVYYAPRVKGGNITVTITCDAVVGLDCMLMELSNVDSVDQVATGTATALTADSGSVTTQHANELLLGCGVSGFSMSSGEGGWNATITAQSNIVEYKVVSATGTYSATATQSSSYQYIMQLVTFYRNTSDLLVEDAFFFNDSVAATGVGGARTATDSLVFSDSATAAVPVVTKLTPSTLPDRLYPNFICPNGPAARSGGVGIAVDIFGVSEAVKVVTPTKLRLICNTPGRSANYVPYLYSRPVKQDRLNDLKYLDFSLVPYDSNFVKLVRGDYIKLQTNTMGMWYTGYITNDPDIERLGTEAGKEVFGYKYHVTSDDYILNQKPIGILPPFLNTTQGDILKALIDLLAPTHNFDVSNIQPGLSLARYVVDTSGGVGGATKYFGDIVKEFSDQANYAWWAKDNSLNFVQQDSVAPALVIDGNDKDFTSNNLKLTPSKDQIINDAIVVGDLEPQTHMTEYFVGDGFTTKFPLISSVWGTDSTVFLDDTFSSSEIDTSKWFVFDDPQNYLQVSNGYLNALGGRNDGSYGVYFESSIQLSLGANLRITHGEYDFVTASDGVVGGLWFDPPEQVPLATSTVYSVIGSGTDISGSSDELNLLSETVNGDGVVTARISALTDNSSASRAGLMFRNGTAVGDLYAAVWVQKGFIGFSYRTTANAQAATVKLVSQGLPKWLRIIRSGQAFTAYYSTDGISWTQIADSVGITGVGTSMRAGMFVCAETALSDAPATTTDTATFDNVALPAGGLSDLDIGSPASAGSYSNPIPTPAAPLSGCLYGIKATKSGGSTILNPLVNGVVDTTQSVNINYNYRYVLRTVYAFPVPAAYAQSYAYMDQSGQIVQLGNTSDLGGEAVFQTWIVAIDPNTAKVMATYNWQNTTSQLPANAWASYCPLVLNDLHCSMTGVTISAPLQASLALLPKGSSLWAYQLIGPNEIDSFDGLAPIATIVDSNQGAVTSSSQLGRLQYNAGSPALEFFYDTTKQTQFVPQVGDIIRLTYSRAGTAMARVQDKGSVQLESAAWGDNGLRSIIRRDFLPLPRTSAECELAASAIVGDLGRQHWDGTYQGWNIYSFTAEPISGMILSFNNMPASFPSTLGVEVIQEVQTTFVAVNPQEIFEHKVQFGRKDGLKKTLALFTQKQDVLPQQDTTEIPNAIDISAVGQVFAEDVIAPTLTKWDTDWLYYSTNQNPPVGGGFEVRYTDDGWGADPAKNLVTRTTGTTFAVPRTIRGRLIFIRAYDARNLLLYSEDLSSSMWGKTTGVSFTNSTLLNPDDNLSLISRIEFGATGRSVWQIASSPSSSKTSVFSLSMKGASGDSYTLKIIDSVSQTIINSVTVTMDGNWQRVSVSGTAPSAMTGNLEAVLVCNGPGTTLYATRASLEVDTSSETVYCKTLAVPYGALSRYASGIHSSLPMIPDSPTAAVDITNPLNPVITVTLPNVQDDVWGYEIRAGDNKTVLHHEDLSNVLVGQTIQFTTPNTSSRLDIYVYCYNLLGEYSNPYFTRATIPIPSTPLMSTMVTPLAGGFEFMFNANAAQVPPVTAYRVYRNTIDDPSSAKVIKTIPPGVNGDEIVVQDMPGGDRTYFYWVSATNGIVESNLATAGGGTSLTQAQAFGRNFCPNSGFDTNTIGTKGQGITTAFTPICDGWHYEGSATGIIAAVNELGFGRSGSNDMLLRVLEFVNIPNGTWDALCVSNQKIPVQYGDYLAWRGWVNSARNVAPPSQISITTIIGLIVYNAADQVIGYYFTQLAPNYAGSYQLVAQAARNTLNATYVRPYVQLHLVNSGGTVNTGGAGLWADIRWDDIFCGVTNTSQDVTPQGVGSTPHPQPLSAVNPSGVATVNIGAFNIQFPFKDVSYSPGSIGGLAGSTKYYIVAWDPTYSGGSVSYRAFTTNPTVTSDEGYILLGVITTPATAAGGTSGSGGGGGMCFSPNTALLGGKHIGNVKAGDMVWVEKDDGTRVLRRVSKVLIHDHDGVMHRMQGEELVTPAHAMRYGRKWVPAAELFNTTCHYKGVVYNLSIDTDQDDEHNYVLANGHCAHNVIK